MKKLFLDFKEAITTYRGWLSWIIANLIVNSPWIVTGILFVITNERHFLVYTTAIMAFQWLPLPIESIAVAFLTILIYKKVFKKGKPTV